MVAGTRMVRDCALPDAERQYQRGGHTVVPRAISRRRSLARWAMLAAMFWLARTPVADADLASRRTPVVQAVQKVQPTVVNITSEKRAASTSRWPFSHEESQRPRVNGMGSGVIVDQRGYILTNHHVVDKVQGIEVHLFDGSSLPARVIQSDKEMDLAMLKIEAGRSLPAVTIGSSTDLMIGETVITIGNAFGYENTVSVGIVSALKRNVTLSDEQVYRNLIQTDACINPGNSGGPLINIDGELIGINVATRSGAQGIGFALPIDDVKRVATEMLSTRRLASKWHGLVSSELWKGNRRSVVLNEVQPGSPAQAAGFQPGDQVIKVGDIQVNSPLDIERGLLDATPGKPSRVLVSREGKEKEVSLDVKALSGGETIVTSAEAVEQVYKALGLKITAVPATYVTPASAQLRGGLYVQEIVANSPASRAMLQKGDIIVGMTIGRQHLETVRADDVLSILRKPELAQMETIPFYIVRRNVIHQGSFSLIANASTDDTFTR